MLAFGNHVLKIENLLISVEADYGALMVLRLTPGNDGGCGWGWLADGVNIIARRAHLKLITKVLVDQLI